MEMESIGGGMVLTSNHLVHSLLVLIDRSHTRYAVPPAQNSLFFCSVLLRLLPGVWTHVVGGSCAIDLQSHVIEYTYSQVN